MATTPAASYPLRFDVEYPESLSRWNTFFRGFLIIPLFVPYFSILIFSALALGVISSTAWFSILSNGRYPRLLFPISVWILRLNAQANAYANLLTDQFPFDERDKPVRFDVEYPGTQGRLAAFFRIFLVIPHIVVLFVLGLIASVITLIAWFAILFTGNFPRGMWEFVLGILRWQTRVNAYFLLLTDRYPPFSMEP